MSDGAFSEANQRALGDAIAKTWREMQESWLRRLAWWERTQLELLSIETRNDDVRILPPPEVVR